MPSVSKKQQNLFKLAYLYKKNKLKNKRKFGEKIKKLSKLPLKTIKKFLKLKKRKKINENIFLSFKEFKKIKNKFLTNEEISNVNGTSNIQATNTQTNINSTTLNTPGLGNAVPPQYNSIGSGDIFTPLYKNKIKNKKNKKSKK